LLFFLLNFVPCNLIAAARARHNDFSASLKQQVSSAEASG